VGAREHPPLGPPRAIAGPFHVPGSDLIPAELPFFLGKAIVDLGEDPARRWAAQMAGPRLGPRFDAALVYARNVHGEQLRKETKIPYIGHLLGVASLVIEDGGDEDEAIAALLHDAVENQGGARRLSDIRKRFGKRVAEIVRGCSDTDVQPKPPWRARKEAYIAHLATAPPEVLRVSLADKLHNARAIVADYRLIGPALWTRFKPDADQLWYYRALVEAFAKRTGGPMLEELDRVVTELEKITASEERRIK
jgi:HD domain